MSKATVFTKTGTKKDQALTLDKAIFGLTPNHELLDLVYRSYLANGRVAGAKTLTRAEVRGGGRKPWRQKGTGRARVGSIRVPNWRGGGVVFGSTGLENYTMDVPTKMKRLAIKQALSAQAADGKILIIESFENAEAKVKATVTLLSKMNVEGNIMLVVPQKDSMIDRATRNIAGLKAVSAKYLNVFDILNADSLVITNDSLEIISTWLGEAKKVVEPKSKVEVTA